MNVKVKKMLSLVLAFVMVLGMLPATVFATNEAGRFVDVPAGAWFSDAVQYVADNGLMVGVDDNHFAPGGLTTRCMVVKVLHRMEGEPSAEGTGFTDVEDGVWYTEAILWAQENGIVEGYGDGTFHPHASMTREEMMAVIYRYSQYKGYDVSEAASLTVFTDSVKIQSYAEDAMAWAVSVGLIVGFEDGTIRPQADSNRAQLATVLMRFVPMYDNMCNVYFNLGIEGIVAEDNMKAFAPQEVVKGESAKQPPAPKPIIGEFTGWYTSAACEELFDFSVPVVEDTIVYAGWSFNETDSDGDNLPDDVEDYLDLDPNTDDTDGDGLKDRLELEISTDPKKVDTDGDGITDYDEDYDNDGLTNGYEVEIGTSPIYGDTDLDWLDDYEEVNTNKTNPNDEDSDDDGAQDGWEIANGFDPLVYNESFAIEEKSSPVSEENPVSASVNLELPGEHAASVVVTPMDASDSPLISATIPGYLGQAYDFTADTAFETATLKFIYDTSLGEIGDTFQPRIYYFNEEEGTFEELPDQIVEDGCVTATVTHFSTYILLNKVEFDKVWEEEIRSPDDTSSGMTGLDVVIVIDSSGSMTSNDGSRLRIAAAKEFVAKLGANDRAAVVDFDSYATLYQEFTSDHDLLNAAINRVDSSGGTNLSKGMNMAISQFTSESYTRTDAYKYVIFLTDGDGSYSSTYTTMAAENGIIVFTIGLGSGVNSSVLTSIAQGTGGKYYFATTADTLLDIYDDVSFETVDYSTDSNDDGISDYFTKMIYEGKLRVSNGSGVFKGIDFNYDKYGNPSADYDGDGLTNGEELSVYYNETTGKVYLTMLSDPTLKHSDNDGVDDYTEVEDGQNPLKEDYYKNTDVKLLRDDNNFYYESYVAMYDDSVFYQVDSAFLGVITGLWNSDGLCRELLIEYFDEYGETMTDVDQVGTEIADDIWLDNLDRLLGYVDKIYDGSTQLYKLKGDIANLIDVIRGHSVNPEVIAEMYYMIVKELAVYVDDIPVLVIKETTIGKATVTALKKSPLETFDTKTLKMSLWLEGINGAIDIVDTVVAMSKVHANYAVLSQNIDFLYEMYEYGNRPVICHAAEDLINALGEGFESVLVKAEAVGEDFGELTINIAKTIASCNPYVGAVTFVIDLINLFTGLSDTIEREYQMVYYSSMADSLDWLISDVANYSGNYRYDSEGRLYRYLVHLAQIRILGEKTYIDYYSHGANKWFNDEKQIAKYVNANIAAIRELAEDLHLKLHKGV